MNVTAFQRQGYQLLHDGLLELAVVEANGIRIDRKLLAYTKKDLNIKLRDLKSELTETKVWNEWRKRFGTKANLTSPKQLGYILTAVLGLHDLPTTKGGEVSTEDEVLQNIDHPFMLPFARLKKYHKALNTFVVGIERELCGDRIHPVFNLHIARTFRSSSEQPNLQNVPVRDKEISRIVRSLVIPSSARHAIGENDFKGIEVNVSACYHKDANFISYITTPGKDMHRDMAAQIYCLRPEDVSKETRYGAKNKFVFPQFYGSDYLSCAPNLWDWIVKGKLTGPEGVPLMDHLKSKGIARLGSCNREEKPVKGTFEHHVREVENDFWNNRFREYGKWRKMFYRQYLERGYFDIFSGFRVHGIHKRNDVTNYPIQGAAFHCLLWCLIQINRKLRRYKMKTLLINQIHDSLVGDVWIDELKNYWEIVYQVTSVELRQHFSWLCVPMEIEYELAADNWFDKQEVKFQDGRFKHPSKDQWTTNPNTFIKTIKHEKEKAK